MHLQFYIDKRHLIYNQLNKPECMLMTHLLSAVFKGVVMLLQGSIYLGQELINIISYVKGGEYPVMSECTKYQLLLQTDYVRLREKYDHLFNYSHIPSYIALRQSSQLFYETKIIVPSSSLTAVTRKLLPAKQWLTETRRVLYYQFVM